MTTYEAQQLGHQHLSHQFEDIDQQNECYIVGMWTFLVTEIMFFGALFLALTVYRNAYPVEFHQAHEYLSVPLGTLNTFILLFSSLAMALAVRAHMLGNKNGVLALLGVTLLCAGGFLVVKSFEYTAEFQEHHFPGAGFSFHEKGAEEGGAAGKTASEQSNAPGSLATEAKSAEATYTANGYTLQPLKSDRQQLFFSLYFAMTGLHGIHILIGILVIGTIWLMILFNHPAVQDFMPVEMTGLYWHFVDIVWIFLFPLIYLIGQH